MLPPDLILHNGRITTLDANYPEATNVAIADGRIVGVDDAEEYERGPNTKVIDLKGRRVGVPVRYAARALRDIRGWVRSTRSIVVGMAHS